MVYEEALKKSNDAAAAVASARRAYEEAPTPEAWKAWNSADAAASTALKDLLTAAESTEHIPGDYGTCAAIPMSDEDRRRADAMAREKCADSSCDSWGLLLARRVIDLLESGGRDGRSIVTSRPVR